MNLKSCRDCGSPLEPNSRGCTTCALNLEAESMIDRFVLRLLVSALTIVAIATGIFLYVRRS
jgi:hypothetical protein